MTLLSIARLWKQIEYFLGVVISTGCSFKKSCMHFLRSSTLHPFFNALLTIVLNFFWFPEDIHIVWKWFLALNRVGQMWFTLTNNYIGHSRGNRPLTSTLSFLKFRFWVTLPFLRYTQGKNLDYSNFLPLSQFFVSNIFFDQDMFVSVWTSVCGDISGLVEIYRNVRTV